MAKLFQGKETPKEEMSEAKALKSGKISMRDYIEGEKSEGHSQKESAAKGKALKSGKMSPAQYAAEHKGKKMADGGMYKSMRMADGGMVCGYRSEQDYGKKK